MPTFNATQSIHADSALDFSALHQLRRSVRGARVSAQAEQDVARQFEALFIAQMLKQARQTTEASGANLFDSPQTQMVASLGDMQMAQHLSTPGLGLAQALLHQMRRATENITRPHGQELPAARTARTSRLTARAPRIPDAVALGERIQKFNQTAQGIIAAVRAAPQHVHDFVARMSQAVHLAAQKSGVPPKLILSQAALESGWGRREIRDQNGAPTHNVFGIKAGPGWQGRVAHVTTTEYRDGKPQRVVQTFRAYASYEDAFADYARLMRAAPRYQAVTQAATPEDAARRVQAAGYATDPAYAEKLISIMHYLHDTGAQMEQPRSV